ncbi:helix-turn-helix domain-containing protein [Deinococcus sp. Arct2-2]|uniref:winged helix-turn-helix transcriptional regulator n=1 Tax=Deinococcus sp. Arct2-2 TaxID=2568653 RepID=UPI001454D617|nr:helix-turn-helix domain-containing protein [Deinococcus sp. Arct2-2]
MAYPPLDPDDCTMVRTIRIIGEYWTLLILREAFFGVTRFDHMQEHLGIARNLLTGRLSKLVEHGLLEKRPYRASGQRTRHEYFLSQKGQALYPALIALTQWGNQYTVPAGERPLTFVRRNTNDELQVKVLDTEGAEIQGIEEIRAIPWPNKQKQRPE